MTILRRRLWAPGWPPQTQAHFGAAMRMAQLSGRPAILPVRAGRVVSHSAAYSQSGGDERENMAHGPAGQAVVKLRTKSLAGRARISAGWPTCSMRPIDMTTTRSASSIASS